MVHHIGLPCMFRAPQYAIKYLKWELLKNYHCFYNEGTTLESSHNPYISSVGVYWVKKATIQQEGLAAARINSVAASLAIKLFLEVPHES